MRALLIPAALAAFIAASPVLAATQTTSGVIKSYDAKAMSLVLADGTSYQLQAGFKDPGLKAGEKVSLTWEMKNGQHVVDSVKIDQ